MSITGKVVIVTGATSGVGRGIAAEFARRGARVVATGRRQKEGAELEKSVRGGGGELVFVQADVTSEADCERVAETANDTFGRIDVLVANAGVVGDPPIANTHEVDLTVWNHVLTTNLTGTFLSCKAVLPYMMGQHDGVIFTISSMNAEVPLSRMAAYNSSKAAIAQFTRTLAIEYLVWGVRANTVILGGVDGDTNDQVTSGIMQYVNGGPPTPEQVAAYADVSAALVDRPERIGGALAQLASDDMATLTAASIHLDKGVSAGMMTDLSLYMTVSGQWSMAGGAA